MFLHEWRCCCHSCFQPPRQAGCSMEIRSISVSPFLSVLRLLYWMSMLIFYYPPLVIGRTLSVWIILWLWRRGMNVLRWPISPTEIWLRFGNFWSKFEARVNVLQHFTVRFHKACPEQLRFCPNGCAWSGSGLMPFWNSPLKWLSFRLGNFGLEFMLA